MKNTLQSAAGIVLALAFAAAAPVLVSAQEDRANYTIRIEQIISDTFPYITIYTVVENEQGEPQPGLSPGLFRFRIDSMEESGRPRVTPFWSQPYPRIRHFSAVDQPIDYSIIFSNSGIMDGQPLDLQKNAILQFIETMRDRDRLSLYTVGEEANIVFEELGRDAIDPAVINAVGASPVQPRLYDSVINVARRVQRRRTERRVIIIISDGRDVNSRFTRDQAEAVLSEVGVPVYALGIRVLGEETLSNLNEIAHMTDGRYMFVQNVSDLPASLRRFGGIITSPYIINLRVESLRADNLPHILEVSLNETDFAGRGQKTFTAVRVAVPRWVRWVAVIAAAVLLIAAALVFILRRVAKRKRMGITRRKCEACGNRMKDSWDTCPFCRYLPENKKKKKRGKEKKHA